MANPVVNNVASPQSVYETRTSQQHALGTRGTLADRAFRYCRFVDTTAIGPNKLAQMCPPVANHVSETGAHNLDAGAGTKTITLTLGATAAYENEYQDGYIKVEGGTNGIGQIYKIRGHSAVASGGVLTAELYDPMVTATSGSEVWTLLANPWADVVIQPTTITAPAAGVTLVNFAAATTAAPIYGWLQTGGVSSCLIDTSNVVAGSGMIPGGAVAGALGVAVETDIKQRVAVSMETLSTDSVYASVYLLISW